MLAYQVIAITIILVGVFLLWNRHLSRKINLKIETDRKSLHKHDFAASLVNNAPVIVLLLDPKGNIEYVNPYFEKLSGFLLDEIKGKEWITSFLPERDHDKVLQGCVEEKSVYGNINPIITRNGEEREIEWHAETMYDTAGKVTGVLSTGQDVTERKKAEQKLRTQAKIIDQIHDSVISTDLKGYITSWNKGSETLLGYTSEEMLGEHISSIYPQEMHAYLENELIAALVKKGSLETEVRLQNKSAEDLFAHLSLSLLYDENATPVGMIGYSIDISDQKRSRIATEKSEERYRALAKVSPVGIFRTDVQGNCTYVNERWCELAGMKETEVVADGWASALHPEDRERVFAEWHQAVINNETFKTECRFQRPDGKITWILTLAEAERDTDANIIGYVGAVTDISDRKTTELALKESEALLEKAQKITKIGHWKLIPATGEVTGSDELFRIFGLNSDQATLESFVEVIHPDDREMDIAAIQRGIEFGESWNIKHRLAVTGKKEKWVHAMGEAITDDAGNIVELVGTVQDISEATAIAQELAKYREHLEDLIKERTLELTAARDEAESANTAKSEFLSRMSHELRTPLNAILGFGQMLELDAEGFNKTQQGNVQEILEAGNHLLNLINEVLDLAKIESGQSNISMEEVDVNEVAQQSLKLIRPQADALDIEIINKLSDKGYVVQADFTRLKQVLVNLLTNAVKYNHAKGHITLDSEIIDNQRLRISISDSENGLTEEEISKLFTPFERLNAVDNVEGTGIGLVITKHLIENMSGSIGIECTPNNPNKGCTFWVEFPYTNS